MKKIYVITRHAIVNYGSYFQTIATQQYFKLLGYDCRIIDYISKNETIIGNLTINSKKRRGLKKILYVLLKFPDELFKTIIFRRFAKKNMNLTRRYTSLSQLKKTTFNGILCSGSDQLWGYMPNGTFDDAYYLNFGNDNNKYISFSSSFGRNDFSEREWYHIINHLKKYSLLTLREYESADFLNSKFNLNSFAILDPTLMIEPSFWYNLCENKKNKNKYILVYQLRHNKLIDEYVKLVESKTNLKAIRVSTQIYDVLKNNTKVLKHPKYILTLFKNAELVITDSFHATVFSIIFNRQFIDILPPNTSLRIIDLLHILNIDNRILTSFDNLTLLNDTIDYLQVNSILQELRVTYSKKILKCLGD